MADKEKKVFQLTVFSVNDGEDYRFELSLDVAGAEVKISKTKEEFLRAREERVLRDEDRRPSRSVSRRHPQPKSLGKPEQQKIEVDDRTGE